MAAEDRLWSLGSSAPTSPVSRPGSSSSLWMGSCFASSAGEYGGSNVQNLEEEDGRVVDCGGLLGVLGSVLQCADVVCVGQNPLVCFLQLLKNADLCVQCVIWKNIKL